MLWSQSQLGEGKEIKYHLASHGGNSMTECNGVWSRKADGQDFVEMKVCLEYQKEYHDITLQLVEIGWNTKTHMHLSIFSQ